MIVISVVQFIRPILGEAAHQHLRIVNHQVGIERQVRYLLKTIVVGAGTNVVG